MHQIISRRASCALTWLDSAVARASAVMMKMVMDVVMVMTMVVVTEMMVRRHACVVYAPVDQ